MSHGHLFSSLSVNVGDETRDGDPKEKADDDDGADDVVLQELEDGVEVEVVDEVPDPLHHVLHRTLTSALKIYFKGQIKSFDFFLNLLLLY